MRRRCTRVIRLSVSFAVVAAWTPLAFAGVVSGRVTADGKPVAGAWVQLNMGFVAVTDAKGRYSMPPLPRATYAVQVFAPGKEPVIQGGVIAGKGDFDADLKPSAAPVGLVHVKVVRADRGELLPARVLTRWRPAPEAAFAPPTALAPASTLDGAGRPLAPGDGVWPRLGPRGACLWTQGEAMLALPPGQAELTCSSGPLVRATRQVVDVKAGQVSEAAVSLGLGVDLAALGWVGGAACCRVSGALGGYVTNLPLAAAVCRAEGMAWVCFAPDYGNDPEQGDPGRTAQDLCADTFQVGLAPETVDPIGGRLATLLPANADAPPAAGPHHLLAALLKRGVGAYEGALEEGSLARELPFDVLADPLNLAALDVGVSRPDSADYFRLWTLLLNHGFPVGALGGDDACCSDGGFPPTARTFAQVEGDRSLAAVTAAIRRGASFVTTGPVVTLNIGGVLPGQALRADGETRVAEVDAWLGCVPGGGLERVELIRGGEVVKTWKTPGLGPEHFQVRMALRERRATWYVLRAYGTNAGEVAWTSPIYFVGEPGATPSGVLCRLTGQVREKGGAPVAGARVTATPPGGRPITATTGEDGAYSLEAPAASMVEVSHPRYRQVATPRTGDPASRADDTTKFLAWDCSEIEQLLRATSRPDLLSWEHYERLRTALAHARLDFSLTPR